MKKLNVLFACAVILLSSFLFFGCDSEKSEIEKYKDQGFTAVYSLEYQTDTYNSSTQQLFSKYSIELEERTEITRDEFNASNYKFYQGNPQIYLNDDISFSVGETVKYSDTNNRYLTARIKSIKKLFVFVKVCDSNLIEIIYDGSHILIQTKYFKVTYYE